MSKHAAINYKRRKIFNILIIFFILFIILFFSYKIYIKVEKTKKYENIVNSTFSALHDSNLTKASSVINYKKLINSLDKNIYNEGSLQMSELEKKLFSDFSWNIEKVKVNENNVVVLVKARNKDFKDIIMNWTKMQMEDEKNNNSLNIFEKCIDNSKDKHRTAIKEITLVEEDGQTYIVVDENLRDLIFTGLDIVDSALKYIEETH